MPAPWLYSAPSLVPDTTSALLLGLVQGDGLPSPEGGDVTDPLSTWPRFVCAVRERLDAGARVYGDTSFSRAPAELVAELQQEALDLAGWGYVLFRRLEAMREALESTSVVTFEKGIAWTWCERCRRAIEHSPSAALCPACQTPWPKPLPSDSATITGIDRETGVLTVSSGEADYPPIAAYLPREKP